ncbi:MAG: DUF3078 domain-containing protein [Crocinitomicaceae bacterium]|nr:DUF3078 domain-containing protein [Crocinitomicaceae bacterium]
MKKLPFLFLLVFVNTIFAQDEEEKNTDSIAAPNWRYQVQSSLNITQTSFTNWAAGGQSNLSGLININGEANYQKDNLKWNNILVFSLGGIQNFGEALRKTDDIIDAQSTLSRQIKQDLFFSGLGGFRTQTLDGFNQPTDSLRSSAFMAPGYANSSLGLEYVKGDAFRVMLSPLSGKFTFVRDEFLSSQGAFGVEAGRTARAEFGSFFRIMYTSNIMENVSLRTRWEFFSNYIENPQNIDVNGELIMNFKVNKWLSATLQANLIYDDDIKITDSAGNVGPRTQFRQVIGLGLAYKLGNRE